MSEGAITISRRGLQRVLLAVLALAVVAALALVVAQQRDRLGGGLLSRGIADQIDPAAYQAIFLTGGQVYFGRLTARGDHYLLHDVFYLSAGEGRDAPSPDQPGQLVKRGTELHGPRDPLIVPAQQVLFIENLRDDAQVVVAIRRFKAGDLPTSSPATPRQPVATPTPSPRPSPTR